MSNIKLQVGEDYLNGMFETIHILSYSNVDNTFRDKNAIKYNEHGIILMLTSDGDISELKPNSIFDLVTHLPKVNKEPTDEDIQQAWLGSDDTEYGTYNAWRAAIEWYKQQIK